SFLYSPKSKVPHTSPGNGNSYISLNNSIITVNEITDNSYPFVNILFYSNQAQSFIGSTTKPGSDCCPMGATNCQYGSIIIQGSTYTTIANEKDYKITLNKADGVDAFGYTFIPNKAGTYKLPDLISNIETTGVYAAFIMNCSTASDYTIEGDIIFMNPYGYLSGEKFPFLYYNLVISGLYVGLFIMWAVLFFKFKETALKIQFWVSFVILLGFIESLSNYIIYSSINKSGNFSTSDAVFMTLFSTLKNGFARALVVLVALGYGIIV
ncbi:hypothetical protein DICPUDRAFT_29253, partial [Dictyostelium purpureum]